MGNEYWHPKAAYLYTLQLDGPALAWEYLRRNPDYRADWQQHPASRAAAGNWGLRLLENPDLDARQAHPLWAPDPDTLLHLYRDADPPLEAGPFSLWQLPGERRLLHDGCRLVLLISQPGTHLHLVLNAGVEDGQPWIFGVRAGQQSSTAQRQRMEAFAMASTATATPHHACTRPRPSASQQLEAHTLQALDGTLCGASGREVATVLFGRQAVERHWHADSDLRARVRRLVQRGRRLMNGAYRGLAQLPPTKGGRTGTRPQRP